MPATTYDLRSDTVTRPSPAMKRAMVEAPLGDDVLGDDPTVKRLEAMIAERTAKEAGLFFPSGTQANETAVNVHAPPGTEILVERRAPSTTSSRAGRRPSRASRSILSTLRTASSMWPTSTRASAR